MARTLGELAADPWGPIETSGFWDNTVFVCGRVRYVVVEASNVTGLLPKRPARPPQPAASPIRPTEERRNRWSRSDQRARPRGEFQLPEIVQDVIRASWVCASELEEVPVNGAY